MATDKRKKSLSEQQQELNDQYVSAIQQGTQDVVDTLTNAGQQQVNDLAAAQAAQQEALNSAQKQYRQRMDAGYTNFADIIAEERRRADQAEQDAIAQREAERKAARWTGATEMAASIANLIAVGGHNAVSQQYHPYSQDWMKQAEDNWRHNRARFDNMRDRQRAMQMQLEQMRMGDAAQALAAARQDADRAYQNRVQLGQTRYNNAITPAQLRAQGNERMAAAAAEGGQRVASIRLQEQSQALQRERYNALYGGGSGRRGSGSGSSSSSSGNGYNVQFDGHNVTLHMNKETREQAIRDGKEEFLKDLMEKAGYEGGVSAFIAATKLDKVDKTEKKNGKEKTRKVDNPLAEYRDIVNALTVGGEDADAVINGYYELHRSEMNNVNRRLVTVANSITNYGEWVPTTDPDNLNFNDEPEVKVAQQVNPASYDAVMSQGGANSRPAASAVADSTTPAAARQEPRQAEVSNQSGYVSTEDVENSPMTKRAREDNYYKAVQDVVKKAAKDSGLDSAFYNSSSDQIARMLRMHSDVDTWEDALRYLPDGETLKEHISDEDRERLRQMLTDATNLTAKQFKEKYGSEPFNS